MSIPSSGSSTERSASMTSSRVGIRRSRVSRQAVVGEVVPRRAGVHERVVLRPDLRVAVERAEPDRDLVALGLVRAEERRPADGAERLDRGPAFRLEDADQLFACEQPELLARHAALGLAEGAGMLAAERAVAVIRPRERQVDLEANTAAETATSKSHQLRGRRTSSRRSRAKKWMPSTKRTQLQRVHITSECVHALSAWKRTPRRRSPFETPVATTITSPDARSSSLKIFSRSSTPASCAAANSLRDVGHSCACRPPPRQRRAAADSPACRVPPIPIARWSFVPRTAAEIAA